MALFIRQNEERSKLQERLAAELQERTTRTRQPVAENDKLEDQSYLKDTKTTSRYAWVWMLVILAAIAAGVLYVFFWTK